MHFVTVVVLGLALLSSAPSFAGALAPAKASDLVVAATSNSAPDCPITGRAFDVRFLPDGTEEPFVIPPKHVLVITSVDFNLSTSPPQPDQTATPVVALRTALNSVPLLQGSTFTDGNGNASGTMVASAGVPVRPGPTLCILGGDTPYAILHGFFAKDK
ncbi:MAG TPA: hypothetical protein VNE71_08815 [Myxococcota bacterium]|nr:hypothetical protein [Myxococcota bacterium]